jgi:hypothetical protein
MWKAFSSAGTPESPESTTQADYRIIAFAHYKFAIDRPIDPLLHPSSATRATECVDFIGRILLCSTTKRNDVIPLKYLVRAFGVVMQTPQPSIFL